MSMARKTFVRLDGGLSTRPEPALLERPSLTEPGNPLETPNALNVHGDGGRVCRRRGCGFHLDTGGTGPVTFISTFKPWPVVGLTTTTITTGATTGELNTGTGVYPTTGGGSTGGGGGGGQRQPATTRLATPVPVSPVSLAEVASPVTLTWTMAAARGLQGFSVEVYKGGVLVSYVTASPTVRTTVFSSLPVGADYTWRIRALHVQPQLSSAWSSLATFKIVAAAAFRISGYIPVETLPLSTNSNNYVWGSPQPPVQQSWTGLFFADSDPMNGYRAGYTGSTAEAIFVKWTSLNTWEWSNNWTTPPGWQFWDTPTIVRPDGNAAYYEMYFSAHWSTYYTEGEYFHLTYRKAITENSPGAAGIYELVSSGGSFPGRTPPAALTVEAVS